MSDIAKARRVLVEQGVSSEDVIAFDWLAEAAEKIAVGQPLALEPREAGLLRSCMEYAAAALAAYASGRIKRPNE